MITSLRAWNPSIPVLLLTLEDQMDGLIERASKWQNIHVVGISQEKLDESITALTNVATPHGDFWNVGWIAAKMDVVSIALDRFGPGVLLVDADTIFTGKIPQTEWNAELVVSRHSAPAMPSFEIPAGMFNAGMILFYSTYVVRRWRALFESGAGGFYEQGCLSILAKEFVTNEFPADWNWGYWRSENLALSGRRPLMLHIHLSDDAPRTKEMVSVVDSAEEVLRDIRRSSGAPDRIAFIHHSKAAGTSLMAMLKVAGARGGWQCLDTGGSRSVYRDWLPNELDLFAEAGESLWADKRRIVHNHRGNWPSELVRRWKADGWVFISTYRDIRERICSLYEWNLHSRFLTGKIKSAKNLDEFIQILLSDPFYIDDFALHPDHELIDLWGVAENGGLSDLVMAVTGIPSTDARENTTEHQSYREAVESGAISKKTAKLVEGHEATKEWDRIGEMLRSSTTGYQNELKRGWTGGPGVCGASSIYGPADKKILLTVIERLRAEILRAPEVLEIGCGDLVWLAGDPPPNYTGIDLHRRDSWDQISRRRATLIEADASKIPIPLCDLVIVRQVFIHLSTEKVLQILSRIKKSGAIMLLASSISGTDNLSRQTLGTDFTLHGYEVDLEAAPFNLTRIAENPSGLVLFRVS